MLFWAIQLKTTRLSTAGVNALSVENNYLTCYVFYSNLKIMNRYGVRRVHEPPHLMVSVGHRDSFFLKDVAPGWSTILLWIAPHPGVCGQLKLKLMGLK